MQSRGSSTVLCPLPKPCPVLSYQPQLEVVLFVTAQSRVFSVVAPRLEHPALENQTGHNHYGLQYPHRHVYFGRIIWIGYLLIVLYFAEDCTAGLVYVIVLL